MSCTPGWSISKLNIFLCAFHRILPCLRATLSFSTLIGQGSPAMAVAKHGCGQMGHLTPLNCKPSEPSAREAFNKDRLAVRFSSNYGASVLYCIVCLQVEAQRCLCWKWLRKQWGEREGKGYQISAGGFLADFSSECLEVTHYWEVSNKEREKKRERRSHWMNN